MGFAKVRDMRSNDSYAPPALFEQPMDASIAIATELGDQVKDLFSTARHHQLGLLVSCIALSDVVPELCRRGFPRPSYL